MPDIRWVAPTYTAIHKILGSPVYAGAYVYGKTRCERFVAADGTIQRRIRRLPRAEWMVLIPDHHEGFINWATHEANQVRPGSNVQREPHQAGGAVREGTALLQGLATCGRCGRRLHTHYQGRNATPGYHCSGKEAADVEAVDAAPIDQVFVTQPETRKATRITRAGRTDGSRQHRRDRSFPRAPALRPPLPRCSPPTSAALHPRWSRRHSRPNEREARHDRSSRSEREARQGLRHGE